MFKPKGQGFRFPRFHFKKTKKPKKPLAFRHVFMISFVIFLGLTVWGLWLINVGIKPTLMAFATTKTKDMATAVSNFAVTKQVKEVQQDLDFLHVRENNDGEVSFVSIDAANVNMLMTTTTSQVQRYLTRLEDGELWQYLKDQDIVIESSNKGPLIQEVPLGLATGNALLANLGPKVPVRFQVIGNVTPSLVGKVTQISINNLFLEVYIKIDVEIQTIIPFATKPAHVKTEVLVASAIITREAPLYYGGRGSENSSVVLPSKQTKKKEFKIAP
ncbi:MAG TPA: sporulation protein YunB [Bacillales bacterium]